MALIANILVALVAALHVYFLILEMFSLDQAGRPQGLWPHAGKGSGFGRAGRQPGSL
jgi:hypothetical protein